MLEVLGIGLALAGLLVFLALRFYWLPGFEDQLNPWEVFVGKYRLFFTIGAVALVFLGGYLVQLGGGELW